MRYARCKLVGCPVALLSVLLASPLLEASILEPHAVVEGKAIGDWAGDWWNWALFESEATNPLTDMTGEDAGRNQFGPVFFMGGLFGGSAVRTFDVPRDKYLLVPLVNALSWPAFADTLEGIRNDARATADPIDSLFFKMDGVEVPETDLFNHREESSDFFTFVLPPGNILGIDPGVFPASAWSDGYWLMLEPLGDSGAHTIEYGGGISAWDFSVSVKVQLIPEPSPLSMALAGFVGVGLWRGLPRRRRG